MAPWGSGPETSAPARRVLPHTRLTPVGTHAWQEAEIG